MNDDEQELMDYLILNSAIEFAGIDEKTGEILYNFSDKLKDVMPELYDDYLRSVNQDIMYLWEMGFLSIDFLMDNPNVKLTEKALMSEEILNLPIEKQKALTEIKRIVSQ